MAITLQLLVPPHYADLGITQDEWGRALALYLEGPHDTDESFVLEADTRKWFGSDNTGPTRNSLPWTVVAEAAHDQMVWELQAKLPRPNYGRSR